GGLLRYGIPNFKLNKAIIDRRIRLLEAAGIEVRYGSPRPIPPRGEGVDTLLAALNEQSNYSSPSGEAGWGAIILATGTPTARDLPIPGRSLKGVHFALELLSQQNRVLAGADIPKSDLITARGKDVLVIGGGDTGSDCIGTAHRQGCKSVTQIEIMPRPVEGPDDPQNPWPNYPRTLKTTSSHEEGCTRRWNINTLEFLGKDGRLTGVRVQEVDWQQPATPVPAEKATVPAEKAPVPAASPAGPPSAPAAKPARPVMVPKGEPFIIKAELCLLAMGFLKPEHPEYPENVFVCGDAANGASLVVRALASGLDTAKKVDAYLSSHLSPLTPHL
ncbi:MAG: FAD-dependent oxidoreductase, partial [Oscillibacter sp.]|nr:FAD-dependent oxidoreductase [Oscillibacter sp.]